MDYRKFTKLYVLLVFSLLMGCTEDEGTTLPQTNCNDFARIDSFSYQEAATSPYTINSVTINEDCLIFNFTATGCDGLTWTMQLADSGDVSETDPPQRNVKLFLINNEACLAEVSRTWSFDLSTLQVEGSNQIIINIDDFADSVTYSY